MRSHPEPGAMRDTLEHLVAGTVRRNDSNKVLFILNQIDTTAGEDNAEEVVAAWQRALASAGLVTGRFYSTYNEDAAVKIENPAMKQRYQRKRDSDLDEIYNRISEVSVERIYRIIGSLQNMTNQIENSVVPKITETVRTWMKRVLMVDAVLLTPLAILLSLVIIFQFSSGTGLAIFGMNGLIAAVIISLLILFGVHHIVRRLMAKWMARGLPEEDLEGNIKSGFLYNTRWYLPMFRKNISGWNQSGQDELVKIRDATDLFIQKLNDEYTNPSGRNM